jgi:hypothetical protein
MPFMITAASNKRFAEGFVESLTGMPGLGFFRLLVNLNLRVEASADPTRLTQLSGDLTVGNRLATRLYASPPSLPLPQYPHAVTTTLTLQADLARQQLEAIEEARGGGELSLILTIHPVLTEPTGETRTSMLQEHWQVNQGVWVGVLEQMQYRRTMLLEVPVPDPQRQPELAHAVDVLGRAQKAMTRGDYRDAVGLCREVLEEMSTALGDSEPSPLPELFSGQRQMSKAERLRVLRHALKVFTHPAHHRDAVSVAMEWNRIDAASTITMVAALLDELGAPDARRS